MKTKSNGKTAVKAIGCILLALAIGVGGGLVGWFAHARNWFGSGTQTETSETGGAIIGEGESNGIEMMSTKIAVEDYEENGISPMAETAYKIVVTATVKPDYATNKKLDWSVYFVNPSSAWATGKTVTDYVTVTASSDGAAIARVECKQAFGEQIKLKVVSRSDPEVFAEINVDYVKKISSISVNFSGADSFEFGTNYTPVLTPVYTDGTLSGTLNITDVDVQLTEGFKTYIDENIEGDFLSRASYKSNVTNKEFGGEGEFQHFSVGVSGQRPNIVFITVSGTGGINDVFKSRFDNAFADAAKNYGEADATLKVSYEYTRGGEQYNSGETTCNINFNAESLVVHVTEIDLNEVHIVF